MVPPGEKKDQNTVGSGLGFCLRLAEVQAPIGTGVGWCGSFRHSPFLSAVQGCVMLDCHIAKFVWFDGGGVGVPEASEGEEHDVSVDPHLRKPCFVHALPASQLSCSRGVGRGEHCCRWMKMWGAIHEGQKLIGNIASILPYLGCYIFTSLRTILS